MKIKDIMHRGVESLAPDASLPAIAKAMQDKDVGVMAIAEKDQLVGMITDRDIALRSFKDGRDVSKLTAKDIMSTSVSSCRDTDDVKVAARIMEDKQIRRLPVLDHKNHLVGMVSLGDMCHSAPHDVAAQVAKAVSAHHA